MRSRLGERGSREIPRRRHQPCRSDARDDRAARRPGRCHGPVVRHRGAGGRRPADRRGGTQHRGRRASCRAHALSGARPRHPGRRIGADPQHGDGRRQHPAAHPLHLFLRRRRLTLQQAQARARAATRSTASTASTRSSAPRRPASPPIPPTCASRSRRSTRSCTCRVAAGARTVPLTDLHRLPGEHPDIETVLQPGELITAVELPALSARGALHLPQGARPGELRLRAGLGRRRAGAGGRHGQGRAARARRRRAQAVARAARPRRRCGASPRPRRPSARRPKRNSPTPRRCATTRSRSNSPRARSPPFSATWREKPHEHRRKRQGRARRRAGRHEEGDRAGAGQLDARRQARPADPPASTA